MYTSDKKMLELKNLLKAKGVIRFDTNFCDEIGILKQNLSQIEKPGAYGRVQHFTPEHIENACKKFNVNANWIFGQSEEIFNNRMSSIASTSKLLNPKKTENRIS